MSSADCIHIVFLPLPLCHSQIQFFLSIQLLCYRSFSYGWFNIKTRTSTRKWSFIINYKKHSKRSVLIEFRVLFNF